MTSRQARLARRSGATAAPPSGRKRWPAPSIFPDSGVAAGPLGHTREPLPIGGGAAAGHITQPGWLIEPGYPKVASISPTVLALTLTGFAFGAAALRYLASIRRTRRAPVWASGVAVSGRRAQYTSLGYANMVRVIFNVVYRVRTQLQSIGDQRFPERLSMMRENPRIFDPRWLYRPITGTVIRAAALVRNVQAGSLGLYLLHLLVAFVALLLVAPRLG